MRALAIVVLLSSLAQAQTPAQMEAAKHEFELGQTAYDLTKYDEAFAHFTKAFELSKLSPILYNLAQTERRMYETAGGLDHLRRSRELYRSYLRLVPISADRGMAESLLKNVEEEYAKQLHAQRDRLLVEAVGIGALALAEDYLAQGDNEAAATALERFVKTPANRRADVARGYRVKARLTAAANDADGATENFARAFALDPSTAPPPEGEKAAGEAFARAQAARKDRPPLKLAHVPPARLRVGATPKLRIELADDLGLARAIELHYRAGGFAFAVERTRPGEVTFPPGFNAALAPGTRIEYFVTAVDDNGAVLDALGSQKEPFALAVDAKPPVPAYKRWQVWVGVAAAVLVAGGIAAAVGVVESPPSRTAIPVSSAVAPR
jgi:tetratricopeptide (TPR) repeat protein